jgi:stage V sporulation protein SpoVS
VKPNRSNGAYDSPIVEQQQKEIQAVRASLTEQAA